MECLKEKIRNLYLELGYVRYEWNLLRELDDKIKNDFEDELPSNRELILSIKDSLWYAIIMRIARICEDDKQVNSIYKVFNCCTSSSYISKQKIIDSKDIEKMKEKLEIAITSEDGKETNLIKCWRDKYLAHYSKLVDPLSVQEEFLLTNKKLDSIIETILEILMTLNEKFNIGINDIYATKQIEILKKQFDYIYYIFKQGDAK